MQDHRAGHQAEHRRQRGRDQQAEHRIVVHVDRENAGRIGAEPEEGRLAERDDAGVTQREVERHREQNHDQRAGAEAQIPAGDVIEDKRDHPRDQVPDPAEAARARKAADGGYRLLAHATDFGGNRPCGRHSKSASTTV